MAEGNTKEKLPRAVNSLTKQLKKMAEVQKKQNRLPRRFLVGLFFGLGTAIGASVIAAILIFIISQAIQAVGIDLNEAPIEFLEIIEK